MRVQPRGSNLHLPNVSQPLVLLSSPQTSGQFSNTGHFSRVGEPVVTDAFGGITE